jgi:hypothetical protein
VRSVLPWIVAYLAILLVWALIILRRTGPTLWKGRSLVAVNLAFVLVSIVVIVLKRRAIGNGMGGVSWSFVPPGLIAFDLPLIIIAVLVRNTSLLLRTGRAATAVVMERCFKQTRSAWTHHPGGYAVQCGDAEMILTFRSTSLGPISVQFTGATDSRKAALLRNLFGKQFHSSFPTPRFRA